MRRFVGPLGMLALAVGGLVAGACSRSEPEPEWRPVPLKGRSESSQTSRPATEAVPPYHASAESARPFPRLVPAVYFRNPIVARAYQIAADIPEVIAQQPCYCRCEKFGHRSLLDCYASDHGAG